MTHIKFNSPISRSISPFNSLVNELFENAVVPKTKSEVRGSFPPVNVVESENDFTLEISAPGFSKEEISISVEDNTLTLAGTKEKVEEEKAEKRFNRKEFSLINFSRSFNLGEEINQDKIDAKFENGIISINLPKMEAPEKVVRKITLS